MSLYGRISTSGKVANTAYIKFVESISSCCFISEVHEVHKMTRFVTESVLFLASVDSDNSFLEAVHGQRRVLVRVRRSSESRSSVSGKFSMYEQSTETHSKLQLSNVSNSNPLIGTFHSGFKALSVLLWKAEIVSSLVRAATPFHTYADSSNALRTFAWRYATADSPPTDTLELAFSGRFKIVAYNRLKVSDLAHWCNFWLITV